MGFSALPVGVKAGSRELRRYHIAFFKDLATRLQAAQEATQRDMRLSITDVAMPCHASS
jgi:hypothetical protein